MPDVENLSISINSSAKNVAQEIDALARSLDKLKNKLQSAEQSAKNFEKSTRQAAKSSSAAANKAKNDSNVRAERGTSSGSTESAKRTKRNLEEVGRTSAKVAKEIEKVGASGDKAGGTVAERFSLASKAGHALSSAASTAARAVGRLVSVAGRIAGAIGGAALKSAGKALGQIGSWAKTAAGGIASIVKQGTFLPMMFGKNLVSGLGSAIKSVGTLLSQFKRVVMYRAIRNVIKQITQGFKEGLENLYKWSKGVGGEFAASMNRIATATQYLKNSLGALASPLLESLAPAIDYVIDKFVALINIINQFLARLSGKSTYIAAKKAAAQWDTAASHAGSAANAMKRYTLAFDELNILGKSSGGGGGGGGGSGTDVSGMFETRPIEGEVSSFADDIMAAFNTQDWARIGELLAGKFNEIIDSIPWPDIGDKIANGVNAAMGVAHSFLVETDFEGLGHDIADLFNHAVANTDWTLVGQTMGEKFGAVLRTVTSLWEGIDFSVLGQRVSDGFNGFVETVTNRINAVDWQWLGQKFSYGLNNLIGGVDWAALGDMLIASFSSTVDLLLSAIETFDWTKAGEAIATFVNKLFAYDWPGLVNRFKTAAKGILDGLKTTISGFSWSDAKESFYRTVAALFDADKFNTEPGGLGELLAGGINTALGVLKSGVSDFTWGTEITSAFATEVNKLISKVDWFELGKIMQKLLGAAISMLKNTVISVEWGTLGTNLATSINGFFSGPDSKQMWSDIGDTFNAALNGALDFAIHFVENFKPGEFANDVIAALGEVEWDRIAQSVWDLFSKAVKKLGNFITVLFGGEIKDPKPIENSATSVQEAINEKLAARNYKSPSAQAGEAVNDALKNTLDWTNQTLSGMPWEDWGKKLGKDFRDFFGEIEWVELGTKVGTAIWEAVKGLGQFIADAIAVAIYGEDYKNSVLWRGTHPKQAFYESDAIRWAERVEQNQNNPFEYTLTPEAAERLGGNYDRIVYDQYGNPHAMYDSEYRTEKLTSSDFRSTLKSDATLQEGWQWVQENNKALPALSNTFSNIGNALANVGNTVWGGIQEGGEKHKWNTQAGYYTLLGGYYDVKEIGENIGQKIADSPIGKLFSGASEQAKTEKALLNQAQFLVAAGKNVKDVVKELDLNEKQTKKLVNAVETPFAIAHGIGTSGGMNAAYYKQWAYMKVPGFKWNSEENYKTLVDVLFQPAGNQQTKYQNQGLMDWLKAIFAPGVDTKTRVELVKNGWKTLPEFVGTNKVLSTFVELVKKVTGQSPETVFGTALTVLAALTKKNKDETPGTVFGAALSILSWLTKKNEKETPATVFGSALSVLSSLSMAKDSKDVKGLYGTTLGVTVTLSKKKNNTLSWTAVDAQGNKQTVQFSKAGGSYYGGSWHDIPQYAGGTVNAHGSMFIAGEAGPEIVGHVGGRTEVLNKSQLASTMFTSVRAAMNPAVETFRAIGNSFAVAADQAMSAAAYAADALYTGVTGYSGGYNNGTEQSQDMNTLLSLVRQGSEATRQQNELLRQQNDLLRQINEKESDGGISTAMLSKAFTRMNLRAGTTVIPVG